MEEETTTPAATDEGVEQTQPVVEAPAEAVTTAVADTEEQTEEAPASVSDEDTELTDWAAKKGLELDSDNTRKAAKMAREAEKLAGRNGQRAGELEKTVTSAFDEQADETATATGQDPELVRTVQRLQVKDAVREFWDNPGVDRSFEPAMIETLKVRPDLKGDLESLYALSVVRSGGVTSAKSQGKREVLTDLAHKQTAAVPTGHASTPATPRKKDFKDLSLAEMEKVLGKVQR